MDAGVRYRVIATAGHVDHGKSALVRALTGVDPDRLREEQERQMTIDLGFGWLTLPSGIVAGVVDVPGHRDFIHNMVAGIGGIDAVLLVVAADEGLMPQTREHISILDLLGVSAGLVVMTKVDLVDEEWQALVEEDVRAGLLGTSLESLPLVRVSSVTGAGLEELAIKLDGLLSTAPAALDVGRPRLPIDRVFSLRGHGTVVTGTLTGGVLSVGDQATILPSGTRVRIRSLQSHGNGMERALPGSRTAANLVGVQKEDIQRGETLTVGGWLRATSTFDVRLRLLRDAPRPLEHADEVHFFASTFDDIVRVRLLEGDAIAPGEERWAQIVSPMPAPLTHGDRFIIRALSPSATIGGGTVVDAHPTRRHRRRDAAALAWLAQLQQASPSQATALRLDHSGPQSVGSIATQLDITDAQAMSLLRKGVDAGSVLFLTPSGSAEATVVVASRFWSQLTAQAHGELRAYHTQFPLRPGMPREDLRRRLRLRQAAFTASLERWQADGLVTAEADRVKLPDWTVQIAASERAAADGWLARLRSEGASGVTRADLLGGGSEDLLSALVARGEVRRLPEDVLLAGEVYDAALATLVALLQPQAGVTVAQVRDALSSNRRATLALLAETDNLGITRREGDARVPGKRFQEWAKRILG